MNKNTLVLVTGANGSIGRAYLEHLCTMQQVRCLAVSRTVSGVRMHGVKDVYVADLTNRELTNVGLANLDLTSIDTVLLIHAVGRFAFEDPSEAHDVVPDPTIVQSNVTTCVNVVNAVLAQIRAEQARAHSVRFVVCAFGSVSDKYTPELWLSFSSAKNMLRSWLSSLPARYEEIDVATLFINISSTETATENTLRPFTSIEEKKYWLQPQEVVERSWATIADACGDPKSVPWQEIAVYRNNPRFHDGYYESKNALARWLRAMGRGK